MNHTHRIIWNAIRHAWVCVAENTATHRQAAGSGRAVATVLASAGLALSLASPMAMAADAPPCVNNTAGAPLIVQTDCNGQTINVTSADNDSYNIEFQNLHNTVSLNRIIPT